MISELEMDDPSFEEVLKHINQATEAGDCKVRVEADGNIKNKKIGRKVKIGRGNLIMFAHCAAIAYQCGFSFEGNKIIFFEIP